MELKWPVVLLLAVLGIAALVVLARRRPRRPQSELPYLARSFRLTELPEYRRAIRRYRRSAVAALALSAVLAIVLVLATARPVRTYTPHPPGGDTPFVDIMLCLGPDVSLFFGDDEKGVAALMNAMREQVDTFANQRFGLTHEFYRVIPVTADHRWVAQRLQAIADLAAADKAQRESMDLEIFERSGSGSGAQPNVVDTLAMCAMGLPSAGTENGRGRQIIYVGNTSVYSDPGSTSPPKQIYDTDTLAKVVATAGIQVNTLVPTQLVGPKGFVEELVDSSGGQQVYYTDIDGYNTKPTPAHAKNLADEFDHALARILADPPPSALDTARQQEMRTFEWDVPDPLLRTALIAALCLAAARSGMRL